MLGADLLGFQRQLGAQNFIAAARRLLHAQIDGTEVRCNDNVTRVGTFPISIDVEEFETLAAGRATRRRASTIRARVGDPEVILLGVDRLDYTKGIGNRLRTFGALLDSGRLDPERHVLVQVATPTREAVDQYIDERHDIERAVGEINGRHARLGYPVIHYLYRTLPLDELVPLYRAADVLLVTPFRDGMNLVAKEFVATRLDDDGVLVLSEFTGAADELHDAVLVNPHDERQFEDAIMTAVDMNRHERRQRMVGDAGCRAVVRCRRVGARLPRRVERRRAERPVVNPELIDPAELTAAMPRDRGRLMLGLDVDGVLAPIVSRAERSELLPGVLPVLRALAHYIPIAIVSGRSVDDLEHLYAFPGDVVVVGSHGLETRGGPSVELDDHERARLATLRELAREAEVIAGTGSWIEQKPASVVLHVQAGQTSGAGAWPPSGWSTRHARSRAAT